ncbi:MAG: META domain-containing protein [Burkholderiales bacterium]|nr:META domain-containing protein [Burkholderiales bacterium]
MSYSSKFSCPLMALLFVVTPAAIGAPKAPATYVGDLPCADCDAIRTTLNLYRGGAYLMEERYLGRKGDPAFASGKWALSKSGKTIRLTDGRDAPRYYTVIDERTLRMRDRDNHEIRSDLPYNLQQVPYQTIRARLVMRGFFHRTGKSSRFLDCESGRLLPVTSGKDFARLEREYARRSKPANAPLLVSFEGRVTATTASSASEAVAVDRFVAAFPGGRCGTGASPGKTAANIAPLQQTDWRLVELNGTPVKVEGTRAPSLMFGNDGRVSGSGGCNRLMGTYTANDAKLTFGPLAGTKMACPDLELETSFLKALNATAGWTIEGSRLSLQDGRRKVLARFRKAAP